MSLSFVSKSIQTTREDGGYEEKPIENGTTIDGSTSTSTQYTKPLFEQLRDQQEEADTARTEFQLSIMRGTLALDEEDAAHLDAVNRYKRQAEIEKQQQTEQELHAFRTAQALIRLEQQQKQSQSQQMLPGILQKDDNDKNDDDETYKPLIDATAPSNKKTALMPKIIVKKRRRIEEPSEDKTIDPTSMKESASSGNNDKDVDETRKNCNSIEFNEINKDKDTTSAHPVDVDHDNNNCQRNVTISGLLTGYGSSSSDDADAEDD